MSIRFRPTLQALDDRSLPSSSMMFLGQLPTETNTGLMGTRSSNGTATFYNATRDSTGTWVPQIVAPASTSYVYSVMEASYSLGGTSGNPSTPGYPIVPLPPIPGDRKAELNRRFDQHVAGLEAFEPTLLAAVVAANTKIAAFRSAKAAWDAGVTNGFNNNMAAMQAAAAALLNARDQMRTAVATYNQLVPVYDRLWFQIAAIQTELENSYNVFRQPPSQWQNLETIDTQAIENGGGGWT